MRWRRALAKAAGIPDLEAHWDKLNDPTYLQPQRPLMVLLNHSDCDGIIESKDCGPLADDLESILGKIDDQAWSDYGGAPPWVARDAQLAQQFIKGLRAAAAAGEDVEFG
jgi:hypothetical protein